MEIASAQVGQKPTNGGMSDSYFDTTIPAECGIIQKM